MTAQKNPGLDSNPPAFFPLESHTPTTLPVLGLKFDSIFHFPLVAVKKTELQFILRHLFQACYLTSLIFDHTTILLVTNDII